MKNTILKSYAKKILRSEAFVSVIIVFVLAIGIIGTSYALYMDVDTDTDYQLVEVGDLAVSFETPNGVITLNNMTPTEDAIAINQTDNIFQFNIYNTGAYTTEYDINLVPDDTNGNQIAANFINYQICKDDASNCTEVKTLGTLNEDSTVTINNPIYIDSLSPEKDTNESNSSAFYFLRLWINNTYTQTTGATIKYKVEINSKNASGYFDNDKSLIYNIINNGALIPDEVEGSTTVDPDCVNYSGESEQWCLENGYTVSDYTVKSTKIKKEISTKEKFTAISKIEDETDNGIFTAPDDYGTSYYYRGTIQNNYVSFAGFIWRIVRINGDGSIRLILNGTLDKVIKEGESSAVYTNSKLSSLDSEVSDGLVYYNYPEDGDVGHQLNSHIGYMYGETSTNYSSNPTYDTTHTNTNSSIVKTYVDAFYEEYLLDYQSYLADTLFCGDKTRAEGYATLGYGTNYTYYGAYDRLWKNSTATPTLKCASKDFGVDTLTESQRAYSRYTSKIDTNTTTSKGVLVNNDLTYPIALISADELVMAGAWDNSNVSYYLYDSYDEGILNDSWWTMTPQSFQNPPGVIFIITTPGSSNVSLMSGGPLSDEIAVRPVINLRADTLIATGDGTSGSPYTIKMN